MCQLDWEITHLGYHACVIIQALGCAQFENLDLWQGYTAGGAEWPREGRGRNELRDPQGVPESEWVYQSTVALKRTNRGINTEVGRR